MGADHPLTWCKDYRGGRSFYTALGNTAAAFDADLTTLLKGGIGWAAGAADPVYSDCGATVLANYEQKKISSQPNLNEPIGFDQLPDGRVIQTARRGEVRLHNPETGTTQVIADFGAATVPLTQRMYTNSEDGLYGPAIDNDFATNKWVYLYYSPQTVVDVKLSDGSIVTQTTPNTAPPVVSPNKSAWDPWVGYFQLSRFKFVEDAQGARLDLASEQQIMKVPVNRQECCHVAGDIDFDKHNNLWLVTGDDNPAGGINGGGFGPANDMLTDEQQTVAVANATGGTFTLTHQGPDDGAAGVRRHRGAGRHRARGAEHGRRQRRPGHGRTGQRPHDHRLLPACQPRDQPTADDRQRCGADRRHGDGRHRPGRRLVPAPDR